MRSIYLLDLVKIIATDSTTTQGVKETAVTIVGAIEPYINKNTRYETRTNGACGFTLALDLEGKPREFSAEYGVVVIGRKESRCHIFEEALDVPWNMIKNENTELFIKTLRMTLDKYIGNKCAA